MNGGGVDGAVKGSQRAPAVSRAHPVLAASIMALGCPLRLGWASFVHVA